MSGWLLCLILISSAPPAWTDDPRLGSGAKKTPPPRIPERQDMIDELERTLGEWRFEARLWSDARADWERSRFERPALADGVDEDIGAATEATESEITSGPHPADGFAHPAADAPEPGPGVTADGATADGVVEASPAPSTPELGTTPSWLERQLAELEARQQRTAEERRFDEEWERAAEAKRKARAAIIEAEARRMQAELDAARRREAEAQARQLGGTLDAEGNFVDPDLAEER